MERRSSFPLVLNLILGAVVGFGLRSCQMEQDRVFCRHAIQREFSKTREDAERILKEQEEWER